MTVKDDSFTNWKNREEIAESMIPIIGKMHRERDVTVLLHSRSLVNKSVVSILKTHRFARQIAGEELSVTETMPFLQALAALDLGPSQIDIGLLAEAHRADDRGLSVEEFTAEAVSGATGENKIERRQARDVVLYGFGRIGRLVARLLIEKAGSGNGLRLRAIVVRGGGDQDLVKRASLLRRDSIHGQFNGTITVDEANSTIVANGNEIKVIYANDPSEVDYTAYGINDAILIDNTGKWRDREGLSKHLRPGVEKVVLTAPGKGDVPNIVHGVNHDMIKPDEQILSCASCTTNAIVPPLKAMDDEYGCCAATWRPSTRSPTTRTCWTITTRPTAAAAPRRSTWSSPRPAPPPPSPRRCPTSRLRSPAARSACRCRTSRSRSSACASAVRPPARKSSTTSATSR